MKCTLPLLIGLCALFANKAYAHSHNTYIYEQPTSYVIVQPEMASYLEVDNAPPADFEEDMGVSPGANYVWLKGSWQWNGNQWVQIHGHWGIRPTTAAAWVPGYWKEHHHKWKWVAGYWQ